MGSIRPAPMRGMAVSYTPMERIERVFEERSERFYENDDANSLAYAFWVGVTVIVAVSFVLCSLPIATAILIRNLVFRKPRGR